MSETTAHLLENNMVSMDARQMDQGNPDRGWRVTEPIHGGEERPQTARGVLIVGAHTESSDLGAFLAKEGYRTRILSCGREASKVVRTEKYAAAFVPEELTEADAGAVLRGLIEADPHLPVIVMGGLNTREEHQGSTTQGVFAVLRKPHNAEEIKRTLRRAMLVNALASKVQQAESALQHSQERFRAVVEAASDAIIVADQQGRILSWNRAAEGMFKYAAEDVIGQPLTCIMPERFRQPHQDGLARRMSTGCSALPGKPVELHGRRKDGSEFPLELSLASWTSDATTFFSGIIRDITERKRDAERFARINQCFLEFGNDPNENITRLTALCGELLGGACAAYSYLDGGLLHSVGRWQTPPDYKAVNKPDGLLCPEVIAQSSNEALLVRHLQDSPYAETIEHVRACNLQSYIGQSVRRGQRYIGALCVYFQRDFVPEEGDRRILGIIASAIGVEEERKEGQAALRRAYDDIESILAGLPSAILIVNDDGLIAWANSLASEYVNGGNGTVVGLPVSELLPEEEIRRVLLASGAKPNIGETVDGRHWHCDREFSAKGRIYRYRCFPISMRGSNRPQTGLVVADITEEKQLQDQLIQAEKLASLGTMVSGMAHEINNPAQAILGMAELIAEETGSEPVKEYACDIAGYAQHIAAVVRDFASYARSSSREGAVDLDLNQRLIEAVKMVRRGPHFGQVEVSTNFADLPTLRARKTEIDQMLVNLIGNAVQAMQGRGQLTLTSASLADRMRVSISDTGCGIPKSLINKIFDPFFTTKDPGKGTGLGLSIVFKIVTKYGGSLKVESEENKGTTFIIEFPVGPENKGGV